MGGGGQQSRVQRLGPILVAVVDSMARSESAQSRLTTVAVMRAHEYTSVQTGPDCTCGHGRVDHVGPDPIFKSSGRDMECQVPTCVGCPRYRPLGPLTLSTLSLSDFTLDEMDHFAERKVLNRTRWLSLLALVVAAGFSLASQLAFHHVSTVLAIVCAVPMVGALAVYVHLSMSTVRHLDPPRWPMMVLGLGPVAILALTTVKPFFPDSSSMTFFGIILLLVAASIVLGLWDSRRESKAFDRGARVFSQQLEALLTKAEDPGRSDGEGTQRT